MNTSILHKFSLPCHSLKWASVLLLSFSILPSIYAQKMMQGAVSSLGVNMRSDANQMSVSVGDVNNEYANYSDQSISSGFIHTSLIYRFEENENEEENNDDTEYSVFPNPTNSETQILFGEAIGNDYIIKVYDDVGKLVKDDIIVEDSFGIILDFSTFSKGVYTIQIQRSEGKNIQEKIIKN